MPAEKKPLPTSSSSRGPTRVIVAPASAAPHIIPTATSDPAVPPAWQQLDAYLEDMITRRRHTLTDDLISDLIRAEDHGDRLTHDELLILAAATLLGAGTDTTRNQLAAAVQVLADHPAQSAQLAQRTWCGNHGDPTLKRRFTPILGLSSFSRSRSSSPQCISGFQCISSLRSLMSACTLWYGSAPASSGG
jgi:hypothetical protein